MALAAVLWIVTRAGRPSAALAAAGLALLVIGYVAYLVRHLAFVRDVQRAEDALRSGDLEAARTILSPLLERYGGVAIVQRAAGRALYALGDPLSAASLLERAARSFADDVPLAATLVASYAALNRGGDARRAAALMPKHVDVRLALAWSELVALGGDRPAGQAIAADLRERADVRDVPARRAMAAFLAAIAAAYAGEAVAAGLALAEGVTVREGLPPYERAFLGYLEGVAVRELGRTDAAIAAFERAMQAAPGTIGEALARRERANLQAALARRAHSSSEASSTD